MPGMPWRVRILGLRKGETVKYCKVIIVIEEYDDADETESYILAYHGEIVALSEYMYLEQARQVALAAEAAGQHERLKLRHNIS